MISFCFHVEHSHSPHPNPSMKWKGLLEDMGETDLVKRRLCRFGGAGHWVRVQMISVHLKLASIRICRCVHQPTIYQGPCLSFPLVNWGGHFPSCKAVVRINIHLRSCGVQEGDVEWKTQSYQRAGRRREEALVQRRPCSCHRTLHNTMVSFYQLLY